ncbi:MAG: methyltransferase [Bacteroidetes bacterium]|nr:MAG: methyltransferase [Bacteroidota bacterium]
MNDLLLKEVLQYCIGHSSAQDEVLEALERETHLATVTPQMIAGPYQGKLLQMLSQLIRPKRALEIGTFTGYAAICIARGLYENGILDTIEVNPEREEIIRKYLNLADVSARVKLHIGNALDIIPNLEEQYQFIFIDAGKKDNATYYDMTIDLLAPGGLMLIDNVLWGGKVIQDPNDKDAMHIRKFNIKILEDERVECVMLPVRDGMTLIRKK